MHREQLQDLLWPELDRGAASANLRKAVYHARRALETVGGSHLLVSSADSVWLLSDGLCVDVDLFRRIVGRARRNADEQEYRRAVGIYGGELLPDDRYEEWTTAPRAELAADHLSVLEELAGLLGSRGGLTEAADIARLAVAADPLREENSVALMRLLALAGRRVDALAVFDQLKRTLDVELGAEPGAEAQHLAELIRSRQELDASLAADEWERVGDLRMLAGDAQGAVAAFTAAAGTSTDPRVERKIADAWLMGHRTDEAVPHLMAAEALADDTAERARILRSRANAAWETGDLVAAQRCAERARLVAESIGTPDDVAAANEALAAVWHMAGAWRDGFVAELDRLARDDGGPSGLARVFDIHHCIGQYHLYGDGLSDSVEDYARGILDRAEQVGAARAQAFAWCLLGESLLLQARWDEAIGCLERSCEVHAGFGTRSGALPWQRLAEAASSTGQFDEAQKALRRASAIATVSPLAAHAWGRIYATRAFAELERDDPDRAAVAVRAAAAAAVRYGDSATCSSLINPVAAEACALLGDTESAEAYAAAAQRVGQMFASSAWSAMAESAAAWAAYARGDKETAERLLATAASLYRRAGQPYWAERAERPLR